MSFICTPEQLPYHTCGHEFDTRGSDGVIRWTANKEVEVAAFIRGVKWSRYQSMDLKL